MKRLAALVVAVGMVVAALVIRAGIDDDSDADGSARLVCAPELADTCLDLEDAGGGDLDVTIESVRSTFDDLLAVPNEDVADPGLDGWLVPEPWPAMVDVARAQDQLRPLFATSATPLARSPLVIIVRRDRARALAENACGGAVSWRCLGDVAGEAWTSVGGEAAWGRVKVGNADPTTSATGLDVVAQAAGEYFGGTDYFLADLQDLAFQSWFGRLEGSARPVATPAIDMLRDFPAPPYDAAGTTEAEAGPALLEAAPDRSRAFRLLYPEPVATANVVLALSASDTRDDDVEELAGGDRARDALAGTGWRVTNEPLGPGLDPDVQLDAVSNLPVEPGVYLALQETWTEVT